MTTISDNLQAVRERIFAACVAAGRKPSDVRLVAASKAWPSVVLAKAAEAGQKAFGENYVQEALVKIDALAGADLEWHFIGPLQSNKTRPVAEHFAWVHSIDRLCIAERLSAQRPPNLPPLQVCVEINVSGELSKSGVAPEAAKALCQAVAALPNIRLRGLMAMPAPGEDMLLSRSRFAAVRELRDRLNLLDLGLDVLSLGMSHDLEAAILEGATMVRVGTAIFGQRNYKEAT
jgi:pyridoxal phosphate enzyme (YggS family)